MSGSKKTITFFGASTGVGLAALGHCLEAGHTCIVLLRTASKLDDIYPAATRPSNLIIKKGNAHDSKAVTSCLTVPGHPDRLVDGILSSIGAVPVSGGLSVSDPDVCKKGITCLLDSLKSLRSQGATGDPLIVAISTISHSRFGRDIALLMVPVYAVFVRVPAADKQIMEDRLAASGEKNWVVVRPSHLVDGGNPKKPIRVGVEDIKTGVESREIGYIISREDVGRWCFENLLQPMEVRANYRNKALSVTW